jgi:hypothetical protein
VPREWGYVLLPTEQLTPTEKAVNPIPNEPTVSGYTRGCKCIYFLDDIAFDVDMGQVDLFECADYFKIAVRHNGCLFPTDQDLDKLSNTNGEIFDKRTTKTTWHIGALVWQWVHNKFVVYITIPSLCYLIQDVLDDIPGAQEEIIVLMAITTLLLQCAPVPGARHLRTEPGFTVRLLPIMGSQTVTVRLHYSRSSTSWHSKNTTSRPGNGPRPSSSSSPTPCEQNKARKAAGIVGPGPTGAQSAVKAIMHK